MHVRDASARFYELFVAHAQAEKAISASFNGTMDEPVAEFARMFCWHF
jgi:hypothetical protein